ncbi:MAG: anthranilate phosphoribosyltransferase [Roseiarcus sp.]|jgi:anthranilate phosphoribosyltransferase|uniref:anthranilate phosphoribosyltransferase n=1 Tax=Roseiarcus sp. TaxID=1969460 RepID=UPI003C1B9A07
MESFKPLIAKVAAGSQLSRPDAAAAFDAILSGEVTPSQLGGFLMALRVRGETVEEITGAVTAMRAKMLRVVAPPDAIDIVGTGGDGSGSYNVSTLAALIVAACGVPVAKHGNRAASSKSGTADTLAVLGVKIGVAPAVIERCIREAGIGFMFAPTHHAAMRHVGPTRAELGTRTIFNLLGPLANPAGVKRQLIGVFSAAWLLPMAEVLRNLGSERVWITHGADGLDEMSTTGTTKIVELRDGAIRAFEIAPEEVGLTRVDLAALKGGDAAANAEALKAVLDGARNAYAEIAMLNAAGALVVAGKARELAEGVAMAGDALASGAAKRVLDRLVGVSNA